MTHQMSFQDEKRTLLVTYVILTRLVVQISLRFSIMVSNRLDISNSLVGVINPWKLSGDDGTGELMTCFSLLCSSNPLLPSINTI